ncbi:hypothetical protein C1Y00_30705, partial [Pseudomonas sp. FW306-2-11AB]
MYRKTVVQSDMLKAWHAAQMHARKLHGLRVSRLVSRIAYNLQRFQAAAAADITKEPIQPVGCAGCYSNLQMPEG